MGAHPKGVSDAVDKSDCYDANLIDISFKFKYFIFVKKSQNVHKLNYLSFISILLIVKILFFGFYTIIYKYLK